MVNSGKVMSVLNVVSASNEAKVLSIEYCIMYSITSPGSGSTEFCQLKVGICRVDQESLGHTCNRLAHRLEREGYAKLEISPCPVCMPLGRSGA